MVETLFLTDFSDLLRQLLTALAGCSYRMVKHKLKQEFEDD